MPNLVGLAERGRRGVWDVAVECPECFKMQHVDGGIGEHPLGGVRHLTKCRCEVSGYVVLWDGTPWPTA